MVAAALLSACVTVRSSAVPGADLAQYQTFGWAQPADPSVERSPAGQTIRNQIAGSLQQKGIVQAGQGKSPDFLVSYHVVLRDRVYGGWGWGGWGYWGGDWYTYTEGTIVVDFIDPRTGTVFWRGSARRDVDDPSNPNLHDVASAVDKLMKKYPMRIAAGRRPSG
jgi:hypothetical protein